MLRQLRKATYRTVTRRVSATTSHRNRIACASRANRDPLRQACSPDDLFYNTPAAGVIVVLNKRKRTSRKDKIVLFNARRHVKKGRPKNYIPEDAIRPLAAAYLKGEPVESEIAVITRQQAEEADYNLSPSRWVGTSGTTDAAPITSLIEELEGLNERDIALTASVLSMLRPLAKEQRPDQPDGLVRPLCSSLNNAERATGDELSFLQRGSTCVLTKRLRASYIKVPDPEAGHEKEVIPPPAPNVEPR
jgi:N-6 DNA Methylase